ncbi:MAG: HEAT repeat domain-containing protein [Planctomycetes bacterium]|nr:HEAT repeat domain-containing protein [Planctomycetota bacterium]
MSKAWHYWLAVVVTCFVTDTAISDEPPAAPPVKVSDLRVPEGYTIELVAGPPLVEHPTMAGFDDQGRLYVCDGPGQNLPAKQLMAELPNRILRLEDRDGDGRFDHSVVYADKMTFPMGALWHKGSVYTASPPHIWKLTDTDDDGVADKREILVSEFGFTGNAADIHGCFLGPDERLYWCDGRHGHNFVDENGKQISKGLAARLFRCKLDGSEVESFAGGGMDNPVEVCFTEAGEPIGTVAIFDVIDGRHDALVHWVYGGAYPRQDQRCVEEFKRTGELMPQVIRFGGVAPSGVMRARGAQFSNPGVETIFATHFNPHAVVRCKLTRDGGTFKGEEEAFLTCDHSDFHPTDVLEDADGSLLVIDTGGWFRIGCPSSQIAKPGVLGAIYRVRKNDAATVDDPRGKQIEWQKLDLAKLIELVGDERPAVRDRAMYRLVGGSEFAAAVITSAFPTITSVEVRQRLVWVLSRIDRKEYFGIHLALEDKDCRVAQVAVSVVGLQHRTGALKKLLELALSPDSDSALRREVYSALGRIGDHEAVPTLLMAANKPHDRFVEHALIYALIQLNDPAQTAKGLESELTSVRRMTLIALDQMNEQTLKRAQVAALLDTTDAPLQQAALDVLRRRSWSSEALPLVDRWLADKNTSNERLAALRGVLLAFCRDSDLQASVGKRLLDAQAPLPLRRTLIEVIAECDLETLPVGWRQAVIETLGGNQPELVSRAIEAAATRGSAEMEPALLAVAARDGLAPDVRAAAWIALARRSKPVSDAGFDMLMVRLGEDRLPVDRLAVAQALGAAALTEKQQQAMCDALVKAGPLELPALCRAYERPVSVEVGRAMLAALAKSPGRDALAAAFWQKLGETLPEELRSTARENLARLEAAVASRRSELASLAQSLQGGDPKRGRDVFFAAKSTCAACHKVNGNGGAIGPDLTKIGGIRSQIDLLESLIYPSASLARGYESYTIVTQDGQAYTGILSRETNDAVYLRMADRKEVRVSRRTIEEMAPSPQSIMPQGFERLLGPEQIRDVIAFLQSLK